MKTRYGESYSKEYKTWLRVLRRCLWPLCEDYPDYGGRGISVDRSWFEYDNFLKDMGRAPSDKHSVDRINNSGGYCKENCRWATASEQAFNRRPKRNVEGTMFTIDGSTRTLRQWAEYVNIPYKTLWSRINSGWDVQQAISEPLYSRSPNHKNYGKHNVC